MSEMKKVCVIGSGVMGAGIAAHMANAGVAVLLLDIPSKEGDKNAIVQGALKRMLSSEPAQLMSKKNISLITPGNLEDDLEKIAECDWVIEVIVENIKIKQDLFAKIDRHRGKDTIVSSNTSTIPLKFLTEGRSEAFKKHFVITHFFNPPRYMRLLEVVRGPETLPEVLNRITDFCDIHLGKVVVNAKDTPGFIANRIGGFWILCAIDEAFKKHVPIEEADAYLGPPLGVPRTGVFALSDLIGLDLMPLLAKSLGELLPSDDPILRYKTPPFLEKMIADGYTGRKGKGGFYRLKVDGNKKVKEAINLDTGVYAPAEKPSSSTLGIAKKDLRRYLTSEERGAQHAWSVISEVLCYTANLIPEISDNIYEVDEAMRTGYNWKEGPFELLDKIGPAWFAEKLKEENRPVPALIQKVGEGHFYRLEKGKLKHFTPKGTYEDIPRKEGILYLKDIKRVSKPLAKNGSAALWDIGDGVICLEFTSKENSIDPDIFAMVQKAVQMIPEQGYKALVLYSDADKFSVGANLGLALFVMNVGMYDEILRFTEEGQQTLKSLKFAPFPVVAAPSGLALGGGCEFNLHSDSIQAHAETYIGLVELAAGLIPGWGGCKETLLRYMHRYKDHGGPMVAISKAFEMIGMAKVSKSAAEAREMLILREGDEITMNRGRLLSDAKAKALKLAEGYQPPKEEKLNLPGESGQLALELGLTNMLKAGKITPYDEKLGKMLAYVLTGGDTEVSEFVSEDDLFALERSRFSELVHNPKTLARVEHLLETGKPLRN